MKINSQLLAVIEANRMISRQVNTGQHCRGIANGTQPRLTL